MYIWGIFLMLGCLAKSSQACSYLSHETWSGHVKQKFSDGFSGCQGHQYNGIKILTLVKDLSVIIDKIALAELFIDYIEEGTWELKALLSAYLDCKGFSGSVLEVKVYGKLRLSIDNECGCPQYEILAGSLAVSLSVLDLPLVDLKLLGILGILTSKLTTQLTDGFIESLTVLLIETITTTCKTVVEKINFEFQSITKEFSYGGDSCSYEATSIVYTDYGSVTSWSLANTVTGSVTSLIAGLSIATISGQISSVTNGLFLSEEFLLTSVFSSISKSVSQIRLIVADFLEWGIFTDITGEVTCLLDGVISEVCEVTATGTTLTSVLRLSFFSGAQNAILVLEVTVSRSIEIVTAGNQISFVYGVIEIAQIIVASGGENCGCSGNDAILEQVVEIVGSVVTQFGIESKSKGEQHYLPNPQPKWVNDNSGSHSCSPHDGCVQC